MKHLWEDAIRSSTQQMNPGFDGGCPHSNTANSLTLSLLMTLEASRSINRYSRRPHRRNTLTALRTLSSLLHPEGDK